VDLPTFGNPTIPILKPMIVPFGVMTLGF
jgi:hypothetical protein